MRRILFSLFILCFLCNFAWAFPPSPPSSSGSVGTVTNTKWCVGDAGGLVQCTQDAPAGTGDMLADGSVPFTGVVETPGVEVKNGADSSGFVDFYEDSSNGTSYFRLYGPEALAGNVFFQLPPTSGTTGGQLYFSSANKLAVAGAGTEGQIWIMGAAIPAWTAVPTWNQNTTGNAATATAFAAAPTPCIAGNYPLGVDTAGNSVNCTAISYPTQASLHVDDILTALGIASEATNFGAFTGSTIADNQTAKAAIQALETSVETKVSTTSAAAYTEPGSNLPLCRTGAGTIGGCTNVTDADYSKSLTPVIDDPDNFAANFTGANLYGGTFIANAAGTAALPNATAGMNFTIVLEGANAVLLEPLAAGTDDTIVMNGLAAAQGEYIESATSGAMCIIQYRAADSWMATCNGFVEDTAP